MTTRGEVQNKAQRATVYAAIDGEREYQNAKWSADTTESGGWHEPYVWLGIIRDYVREADTFWCRNPNPQADDFVKNALRKIAALSVAGLEQNGVILRSVEGARPVGFSAT